MVTPPKGDYASVPLNAEGRRVADAGILPGQRGRRAVPAFRRGRESCGCRSASGFRGRTSRTLKIETDAGTQTRLFRFGPSAARAPSRPGRGRQCASWVKQRAEPGPRVRRRAGDGAGVLKVVTTQMRPGYLRWNGVPYSEAAVVTEYYNRHSDFGVEWFTVTTVVEDLKYLTQPFITSSSFRNEPDDSKCAPTPCETVPPRPGRPPGTSIPDHRSTVAAAARRRSVRENPHGARRLDGRDHCRRNERATARRRAAAGGPRRRYERARCD